MNMLRCLLVIQMKGLKVKKFREKTQAGNLNFGVVSIQYMTLKVMRLGEIETISLLLIKRRGYLRTKEHQQ